MLGALFSALSGLAHAQDLKIDSAQFSYANAVKADRYSVLRMQLSSGDRPWSGILSVRTGHDGTQDAITSVRFSTTPGVLTPVEIPVLLPMYWSSLEFSARGDGRPIKVELRSYGSDSDVISPPSMPLYGGSSVLCVGETSALAVLSRLDPLTGGVTDQVALPAKPTPVTKTPTGTETPVDEVHPSIQIATDGLPVHVEALDQFEAVLISERSLLNQSRASRETLGRWVLNGGKLLISMESAGAAPIALFPEFEPFLLDRILIHEETSVTAHASLSTVARGISESQPELIPTTSRTMEVTPTGATSGWTLPWTTDDGRGILARGPVGFGIVGFLCVDPKSLVSTSATGGDIARRLLWEDALRVVSNRDNLGRASSLNDESSRRYLYAASVGPSPTTEDALKYGLEQLPTVESLGFGILAGIVGMMMLLGLLIGPGDMWILKKIGQRHRSWMTACGWIGLASLIAAILPLIFRDGKHGYSMLVAHDIIQLDEHQTFVARTGLIGIFGGRPDRLPLPPHDSGTIWRGVGTTGIGSTLTRTFEPLLLISSETGQAGSRSSIMGDGESSANIRIGQWNFRTLMFNEPGRYATTEIPKAHVRVDDFGIAIELKGLQNPSDAELIVEGRTVSIPLVKNGDVFTGTWDRSAATNQPPSNDTATTTASTVSQSKSFVFNLQWAEDRADAMHTLEHDGEYVLVTVSEQSNRIESVTDRIGEQGRTSLTNVYRIATRVERVTP